MVRNAVPKEFLNTLKTGTTFPRVPLEMTAAGENLAPGRRDGEWRFEKVVYSWSCHQSAASKSKRS